MSAVIPSLRGVLRSFDLGAWKYAGGGYVVRRDATPSNPSLLLHTPDLLALFALLLENGDDAKYLLGWPS
jgi:hypothetical protein